MGGNNLDYREIYNVKKYEKEFNKINFDEYKLVKAAETIYIKKFIYEHKIDSRYTIIDIKSHALDIRKVSLYYNNERHADNCPAMFEFHNNKLTQVQYWINGKHYNLIDAPAEIDFDITGKLKTLRFNNKNELLSRINGPAEIYFYDGYYNEYYFINGVYYTKIKYYDLIDKVKNKKIYCGKYKKENLIIIKEIAEYYQMTELINKIDSKLLIEIMAEKY